MATYGNGVAIGKVLTAVLLNTIPPVLILGRSAWTVAVAGTSMRGAVVFPVVAAAPRQIATTTSACASPSEVTMFHL